MRAGHSLSPMPSILPVEDAFTDLADMLERAITLKVMLDLRFLGDSTQRVTFAFADAAWRRVLVLAELTVAVEALTPQCMDLQRVARCILTVLSDRNVGAMERVVNGLMLDEWVVPLDGADARIRRTQALIETARCLVASQPLGLGMRIPPVGSASELLALPSVA